jgi:DNA-directed RNA polymerase subunit M/transcription elongation factor TFIIS
MFCPKCNTVMERLPEVIGDYVIGYRFQCSKCDFSMENEDAD